MKKAFVYTHLGLGDMILTSGAIRFLRERYEAVYVVCKDPYKETMRSLYEDDPEIRIVVVASDDDLHPWAEKGPLLQNKGFDVFGCGQFSMKPEKGIYDFPNSFYDDMDIPRSVRKSHFHIPRTPASKELHKQFAASPYIVVHQEASTHTLPIVDRLKAAGEKRLIINLTQTPSNQEGVISLYRPLTDYVDLMEGAEELHLIDSSIFCFTSQLNLKTDRPLLYYIRPGGHPIDTFNIFQPVTEYM